MSIFDEMIESSPELLDAYENGVRPIPAGEYRLVLGDFKAIRERKSLVLKFLVLAKGDGSDTESRGRSVDLWLNYGQAKTVVIARERESKLGLSRASFADDTTGKLPEIITVRALVGVDTNPKTGVAQNAVGKIIEIISREPQDVEVDTLEAY